MIVKSRHPLLPWMIALALLALELIGLVAWKMMWWRK